MSKGAAFAQGFADAFVPIYTARKQAEQKTEQDKIRIGAQTWLDQKSTYDSAKQKDEALWSQAESLVASETSVPKDATTTVFNMLKGGRSVDAIIKDVRAVGAKFEAIKPPVMGEDPVLPTVEDQSNDLFEVPEIGAEATTPEDKPNFFEKIGDKVGNVFGKDKKPESDNPFDQYKTEIQEYVGEDTEYFDQVISGYQAPERKSNYTFVPGVTKSDSVSLDQGVANIVFNSQEFKDAQSNNDTAEMFRLVRQARNDTAKSTSADGSKSEFDVDDPTQSFLDMALNSKEGKEALKTNDVATIGALVQGAYLATVELTDITNKMVSFNPAEVTDLNQIPGLRELHKDSPNVISQLDSLEEQLDSQTESGRPKMMAVFGTTPESGEPAYRGMGELRDGKLFMASVDNPEVKEEVPLSILQNLFLISPDNMTDVPSMNTKESLQIRSTLTGVGDLLDTSTTYLGYFETNEYARTRVGKSAKAVDSLLQEFKALKDIAKIIDPDGGSEEKISKELMLNGINENVRLGNYTDTVAAVLAQEVRLTFAIAKSQGNSGQALSNKDYDNYYASIFNSNKLEVVRANIEQLVAESYSSAVRKAEAFGEAPGMKYVTAATGKAWWKNPNDLVLAQANPAVSQMLQSSLDRVEKIQMNSSYGQKAIESEEQPKILSVSDKIEMYKNGEDIFVDEAFVKENPLFESFLGTTINGNLGSGGSK